MTDIFSKKKRSEIMSKIRSKDTEIEKIVFSYLRRHKIYFQKHYRRVLGNPDIALPSKKKAVFIDGDFWHGRYFSKLKERLPKIYWLPKIQANIRRDKKNRVALKRNGWKVLKIWGNDLKKLKSREKKLGEILEFLKNK